MKETGNEVVSSDFLRVLLTLKDNIMNSTHVCELCKVIDVKDKKTIQLSLLNNNKSILYAYNFFNLELTKNQIVLVIFTDSDNRINLSRKSSKVITQTTSNNETHSIEHGIIVGIDSKGSSALWGAIEGDINTQSDLMQLLNDKADNITVNNAINKLNTFGNIELIYEQTDQWATNFTINVSNEYRYLVFATKYRTNTGDLAYSMMPIALLKLYNGQNVTIVTSDSIYITYNIAITESTSYFTLAATNVSNGNGYNLYIYGVK